MRECLSNALAAWSEDDYGTALKEYLKNLIMSSEQERMDKYQEQFARLLATASAAGVVFDDRNKRLQNDIYPKSPLVLWTLANMLVTKDPFEALSLYAKAGSMSCGLDLINTIGSAMICRSMIVSTWHISMINDTERNLKFNIAMAKIIKPTTKVVDIGAGTALLSMFAARKTEFAVEALEGSMPMATIGNRCVCRNNMQGKVLIYPMMSSAFTPVAAPDVIMSETMDAGGLGEKILQIFHDSHARYRGGNPAHPLIFCPNKLTFFVALIQSDSFWRSRMHAHSCRELGCGEDCHFSRHENVLVSDHDFGDRSHQPRYTTLKVADFDDVVFLSDHVQIFDTPLDNEQFLKKLKEADITMKTFSIPITSAGRVDAALLCWRATLAEGVELDSVRPGGWDYAAFPLPARTEYAAGARFHGEYVVNFTCGISINHIEDPATTPGRKVYKQGPYTHYHQSRDDGCVEMANNESLRRFLFPETPSRQGIWLANLGMDPYFPVTYQGVLQQQYLERVASTRARGQFYDCDTIRDVKAYGCLFKADHIHRSARPNCHAHLGVDLSPLDEFSLAEYREIRGAFRGDGRFKMLSEPVLLIDLDTLKEYEPIVVGERCEVTPNESSVADGILYWWVVNGQWDNAQAGLPLAAFLFTKRERVQQGGKMRFNVFLKDSEFVISYGDRLISDDDTEIAPQDDADAAMAPPPVARPAPADVW